MGEPSKNGGFGLSARYYFGQRSWTFQVQRFGTRAGCGFGKDTIFCAAATTTNIRIDFTMRAMPEPMDGYFSVNNSGSVMPVVIGGLIMGAVALLPLLFLTDSVEGWTIVAVVFVGYYFQLFVLSLSCTIDFNSTYFRISNIYRKQKFVESSKFKKISSLLPFTNWICLIHFNDGRKYLFFSKDTRSPLEHPLIGNMAAEELSLFIKDKLRVPPNLH